MSGDGRDLGLGAAGFPDKPLIYDVGWKTAIYVTAALLFRLWLVVLFLAYCSMRELIRVVGRDRVKQMIFGAPGISADQNL